MNNLNNKRLARAIESARFPLTLRQIGEKIQVSAATLSRIENGKTPDIETYYKVCQWLGVPMEEFFKQGVNCYPCKITGLGH